MNQIEQLVERIRNWEMDAGESFTDYFLDMYSYSELWLEFLGRKGFTDVVAEIRADVITLSDGVVLSCTDQQLKFEPHSSAAHDGWDEAVYLKDVALWAEFILEHEDITRECEDFLSE